MTRSELYKALEGKKVVCFSFVHSVETRDLISCLGKDGNLPTDEISRFRKDGTLWNRN